MFLPADLYAQIESSMPIACVDFIPVRGDEVGLILRRSPFGPVWCHLGGRIERGETIADALRRHASDTLAVGVDLPLDPQPAYVYQWFPAAIRPNDGIEYGDDPRKHAIGLSFVVKLVGEPEPRNEALDFKWFDRDSLPESMWPGSDDLVRRLVVTDPPIGHR